MAKHAQARSVEVILRRVKSGIGLEIQDDGRSFRPTAGAGPARNHGLGLLGMQERVRLVDGKFLVVPDPGKGTTVRVRIPFNVVPDRHQQNRPYQYHNGGIWPFIGGFWAMALAQLGKTELARHELGKLALANSVGDWRFTEWFHGKTLAPMGMPGQSWNAAAFLAARRAIGAEAQRQG